MQEGVAVNTGQSAPAHAQNLRSMDFTGAEFKRLLVGEWQPIRASPFYVFSLLIVAALVILLPLIYLGIIGLTGYGVYWAVTDLVYTDPEAPAPRRYTVFLGILLAILGAFVLIILVKPLIIPARKREDCFTLYRENEPRLYGFIDSLCELIGAPKPRFINVVSDVNASASFRNGIFSLFSRNDMILTIGMPLAAGLTVSQFAGIMAHELGHFSQSVGLRAHHIIRSVQFWLVRAVYERDLFDQWIHHLAVQIGGQVPVFYFAYALIMGISRAILFILLCLSNIFVSILSRQMEFNADRYETQLTGAKCFENTSRRMSELGAGLYFALEEAMVLHKRTRNREIPDDLPALAADHAGRVTKEMLLRASIAEKAEQRGLFLTHPPTHIRIAQAHKRNEPGILKSDAPASSLFADFHDGCRTATFGLYKELLQNDFYDAKFVPTTKLTGGRLQEGERRACLIKFLGFDPPTWRPFFPRAFVLGTPTDPKRCVQQIKDAKATLRETSADASAAAAQYLDDSEHILRIQQARAAIALKLKVNFTYLNMLPSSSAALAQKADLLQTKIAAATDTLESAMETGQARLAASLSLLCVPAIASRIRSADTKRARAQTLLTLLGGLRDSLRDLRELRSEMLDAECITKSIRGEQEFNACKPMIRTLSDKVRDRLMVIRERGGGIEYPYANLDRAKNLGERLVGASPGWREFEQIFDAGSRTITIYAEDQRRAIAELVEIAAHVEQDLARSSSAAPPSAAAT